MTALARTTIINPEYQQVLLVRYREGHQPDPQTNTHHWQPLGGVDPHRLPRATNLGFAKHKLSTQLGMTRGQLWAIKPVIVTIGNPVEGELGDTLVVFRCNKAPILCAQSSTIAQTWWFGTRDLGELNTQNYPESLRSTLAIIKASLEAKAILVASPRI